ncbi:MAG: hypothetical protein KDH20_09385 [Rhodocyclaceae bacterium]|nr:hypothetical protein [Rhodocyclaceae bacterium]
MELNDFAIARAVHVLAVLLWIGGVAFVTTTLLPACRALAEPGARIALFESLEHRFAWQARGTTLAAGASGFWLAHRLDAWHRFADPGNWWWMHTMVALWAVFTLMLFVLEPLVLRRWFAEQAAHDPQRVFARIERMHRLLLALSLLTVAGAVAGSHGGWTF